MVRIKITKAGKEYCNTHQDELTYSLKFISSFCFKANKNWRKGKFVNLDMFIHTDKLLKLKLIKIKQL